MPIENISDGERGVQRPVVEGEKMKYASWQQLLDWVGQGRSPDERDEIISSLIEDGEVSINGVTPAGARFSKNGDLVLDEKAEFVLSREKGLLRNGIAVESSITTPILFPDKKSAKREVLMNRTSAQLIKECNAIQKDIEAKEDWIAVRIEVYFMFLLHETDLQKLIEENTEQSREEAAKLIESMNSILYEGLRNEEKIDNREKPDTRYRNPWRFVFPTLGLRMDTADNTQVIPVELDFNMQIFKEQMQGMTIEVDRETADIIRELKKYRSNYKEVIKRGDVFPKASFDWYVHSCSRHMVAINGDDEIVE